MGFGVWGFGFRVWVLGFGVWVLGFGVWALGFGVYSFHFWGSGLRGFGPEFFVQQGTWGVFVGFRDEHVLEASCQADDSHLKSPVKPSTPNPKPPQPPKKPYKL